MFEFELRLLTVDDACRTDQSPLEILKERLAQFQQAVDMIVKEGWPMKVTPCGVAFTVPDDFTVHDEKGKVVHNPLTKLEYSGFPTEMLEESTRPIEDIEDAYEEYMARLEYARDCAKLRDPYVSICKQCQDLLHGRMRRMEDAFGARSMMVSCGSDFERGVVQGKHEALSWVLGDAWEDPVNRIQQQRTEEPDIEDYPDDDNRISCECYQYEQFDKFLCEEANAQYARRSKDHDSPTHSAEAP